MTDQYYAEIPEKQFRQMVEYYSNLKKYWNMGVISLPRKDIKTLIEVQKATDKLHLELNHIFDKRL
jgi:hypothetical protein